MELYLHIPFCVRKCLYCDFLSFPESEAGGELRQRYVDKLSEEIRSCGRREGDGAHHEKEEVTSVFFGGGTPSLLTPAQVHTLMEAVRESFHLQPEAEITIEANPGAFDEERARCWRREGINRLSLGLQSADRAELQCLGRIHTFEDFLESFALARKAGFENINVDLMSALPGQTPESFHKTLKQVTALSPEHISAYSLIVEEGTPFYLWYGEDGEKEDQLPEEEEDRRMYHETKAYLEELGYRRYEISNYALPGRECRHNIGYWDGTDYLGLGLGAASLRRGRRFAVTTSLETYLSYTPEDFVKGLHYRNEEILTEKECMEEFMFLGLRMTEGVSASEFKRRFQKELEAVYWEPLSELEKEGLIDAYGQDDGRGYRLTEYGLDVSNYVLAEFLL